MLAYRSMTCRHSKVWYSVGVKLLLLLLPPLRPKLTGTTRNSQVTIPAIDSVEAGTAFYYVYDLPLMGGNRASALQVSNPSEHTLSPPCQTPLIAYEHASV